MYMYQGDLESESLNYYLLGRAQKWAASKQLQCIYMYMYIVHKHECLCTSVHSTLSDFACNHAPILRPWLTQYT